MIRAKVLIGVVISLAVGLTACESEPEKASRLVTSLNLAVDDFDLSRWKDLRSHIDTAEKLHRDFALDRSLCSTWITTYFYFVEEHLLPYARWKETPTASNASSLIKAVRSSQFAIIFTKDEPWNVALIESSKCDQFFPGLTEHHLQAAKIAREKKIFWEAELRESLGEISFAELSDTYNRDRAYDRYVQDDKYTPWMRLTEERKDYLSGGDQEVRACLDGTLANNKAAEGVSKADIARLCRRVLRE